MVCPWRLLFHPLAVWPSFRARVGTVTLIQDTDLGVQMGLGTVVALLSAHHTVTELYILSTFLLLLSRFTLSRYIIYMSLTPPTIYMFNVPAI